MTQSIKHNLATPTLAILFIAPFFGEVLSTSTSPLQLLNPWVLGLMVGLYGCGALIVREVMRRLNLGLLGLLLLATAYGAYEEALIDRFWYNPVFWEKAGVGTYGVAGGVNVFLAAHLTAFHVAISIFASILVVERLFPAKQDRPWVRLPGLVTSIVTFFIVLPIFTWDEFPRPSDNAMILGVVLFVSLVLCAIIAPRQNTAQANKKSKNLSGKKIVLVSFLSTALHFILTYTIPHTGIPWTLGILLSLLPIAIGVSIIQRLSNNNALFGDDRLRIVIGMLWFFAIFCTIVGLLGRFDLTAAGIVLAYLLIRTERKMSRLTSQVSSN